VLRARRLVDPQRTVAGLLGIWLEADDSWRPSTRSGYRSTAAAVSRDAFGGRRLSQLTPTVLRAACVSWTSSAVGETRVAARVRMLRAASRWATLEGLIEGDPLAAVHGPAQSRTRLHLPVEQVRALIAHAEQGLGAAREAADGRGAWTRQAADLHRAEQVLLRVRLAADSGARRGELAALQLGDLDGRVLTISRGTSMEVVGPTKTGRIRRMTVGSTTASLWAETARVWYARAGAAWDPACTIGRTQPPGHPPIALFRASSHRLRLQVAVDAPPAARPVEVGVRHPEQ
jgi:integrase